jgi:hypothetical protein
MFLAIWPSPEQINAQTRIIPTELVHRSGKAGQVRYWQYRKAATQGSGKRILLRSVMSMEANFSRRPVGRFRAQSFRFPFAIPSGPNGRPRCTLRRSDSSSCTSSSRLTCSSQSGGTSIGHVANNDRSSAVPRQCRRKLDHRHSSARRSALTIRQASRARPARTLVSPRASHTQLHSRDAALQDVKFEPTRPRATRAVRGITS